METTELPRIDQSSLYPLSIPWSQIVDRWLAWKKGQISAQSYELIHAPTLFFSRWLGNQVITPAVLYEFETYMTALGRGPVRYLRYSRNCYRYALHQGFAARDPWKEYRMSKGCVTKKPRKRIPHDVWEKSSNTMAYHKWRWAPVWDGCYETALAACDVVLLQWGHINRQDWTITKVREKMKTRGGRPFTTAIDPNGRFYGHVREAARVLKERGFTPAQAPEEYLWPELVHPWREGRIQSFLKDFLERHGLPLFTYHDLRATRISAMVDSGVSPHTVCAISGHSNPSQVIAYVRSTEEAQVDAILKSNSWSRKQSQSSSSPPSPSAPTGCLILSDSASGQPDESLALPPSSSRTTFPSRQEWLRQFAGTKRFVTSAPTDGDPTAPGTGKPSS
jgi:integrase